MTRAEQIEEARACLKNSVQEYGFSLGAEWADKNPEHEIKIKEFFNKTTGENKLTFEFNYEGDLDKFTAEMKAREEMFSVAKEALAQIFIRGKDKTACNWRCDIVASQALGKIEAIKSSCK